MNTLPDEAFATLVAQNDFAKVLYNSLTRQHSLYATAAFEPDECISSFHAGETLTEPNYLTVQVDSHRHITLMPDILQYMNHSCTPNAFFDTTSMKVISLRHIKPGDEITFFYPSTEWNMQQPFICNCGAPECLGWIQGASYLSFQTLRKYRLTDFIRRRIREESLLISESVQPADYSTNQ